MRSSPIRKHGLPSPIIEWQTFDPEKIVHPSWLIEGLIPEGSTCCIYGAPNTGKSFVALDMALSIATGRDWLNIPTREKVGKIKEPGKVVYILSESPEGLHRRIAAWLNHKGTDRQEGAETLATVFFMPIVKNIRLNNDKELSTLKETIANKCKDPALIIFDPLISFMDGDENSAGDMQSFIGAMRDIVETFKESRCSVMVVHHSGKDGSRNERGSSALRGGVDTHLWLSASRLVVEKQRDAGKRPDIFVELLTVVESTGDEDSSENKTRDLGKVVIPGSSYPTKATRTLQPQQAKGAESGAAENSADIPTPDSPIIIEPKKPTKPQIRAENNRRLVISIIHEITRDRLDQFVSAADIRAAMGRRFRGKKTTLYNFFNRLAREQPDKPAVLIKDEGKYRLAQAGLDLLEGEAAKPMGDSANASPPNPTPLFNQDGPSQSPQEEISVHLSPELTQDGTSRPAEEAAPPEG
jgi:hypothetical protein